MSAVHSLGLSETSSQPLTEGDYRELERSGITREMAHGALLFRISNADAKRMLGRNDSEDYAGIVFPYFAPGEKYPCSHRVRRDSPPVAIKRGKIQPEQKYLSPPGDANRAYWEPATPVSIYSDTSIDLICCEGQKKVIALGGAVREHCLNACVVGLNGVWGFRGKTGIRENSRGQRQQAKGVIPDIERISFEGRTVFILFDTNVTENPMVAAARNELASEVAVRGGRAMLIDLAPENDVNGIDDFIGKHGRAAAIKLLESAREFDPSEKIASLAFTDFDNEQVFEMLFAEEYRFNATAQEWLFWDENVWAADQIGRIDRSMIAVANARLDATAKITDETEQKRSVARALKLRNVSSRRAAIESSQSNTRFVRRMEDFDKADHLFACANGVIDLRTGDFRRGRRSDMLTKASAIEWNPTAPYDHWLQFLYEVFAGNVDVIRFVQSAAGYTLTGLTQEEVFFLLYGGGRNGKGTLLRVLGEVFGAYAGVCEFSTLLNTGRDGRAPRNDIAAMVGKRLIISQESREGAKLDESLIKSLTGGDLITARFLNQEFFTFRPTWKIWLATNHRPEIKGTDTGIWSRPKLIPFTVSFEGKEDKTLKGRLIRPESLSGVLRWAVEGCMAYQRDGGLKYPDAVTVATDEYRAISDQVGRFIEDRCVRGDFASVPARRLYEAYSKWATDAGERETLTETAFGSRLTALRYQKKRGNSGNIYLGIGLRNNADV